MSKYLDQAQTFHQAGRLAEAEALYRRALEEKPNDLRALRPLGIIEMQQGRHAEALSRFERVLARRPEDHEIRYYHGISLQALGRHEEAVACYDRVLRALPELVEALNNRGIGLQMLGRLEEAVDSYDKALAIRPELLDALLNRGSALHSLGRDADALASYDRALALRPNDVGALVDRSTVLHALGRHGEALTSYDRALALAPDHAEAFNNRGATLQALGRIDEALASYDRALALQPASLKALINRGSLLHGMRRNDEALASYDKALALQPADVQTLISRAALLHSISRHAEALAGCEKALAMEPDSAAARWALTMFQIPPMCETEADAAKSRAAFMTKLEALDAWFDDERLEAGAECVGAQQPFFLAYQEENNRELLRRYGTLCARIMGRWLARRRPAPSRAGSGARKIRVGVASPWFYDQSVWTAIVKGWFQEMDRERFSLHAFHLGTAHDGETEFAKSHADHFEQGPRGWGQWVDAIVRERLDVLIYPEIGMDGTTAKLASMRLAPVQLVTWGHPETSGLPTIDYFLSAQDMEPDGAEQNYTERLVRLPNLGCFYSAMHIDPPRLDLETLGVGKDGPLLVCPAVPVKYAPQHDWMIPEIARRLGRCRFVFFTTFTQALSELLARRIRAAFDKAGVRFEDFVTFIPWQSRDLFYGLLKRADVYLDTIGFSGFNTAIQAVECGLPIVTREGRFLRGRLASGILKRLGLAELVVQSDDQYVELAVRLARDTQYRSRIRTHIEANRAVVFEDKVPVRALEAFLVEAVAGASSQAKAVNN